MAVRAFTNTEHCRLNVGGLGAMTFGTFALLVKVDSSGAVKTPFCLLDSAQGYVLTPFQVTAAPEAAEFDGIQIVASLPTAVWLLVVVRKATGTAAPRTSYYNYNTTTWTHANAGTTHANWTAPTSGFVNTATDGTTGEAFVGRLAVTAAWSNALPWSADSTGDSALVASGLITSLSSWVTAAPSALWPWNPVVATGITDLVGSANQAAIVGTTLVNGDDPPGFDFALSAAPTVVQAAGPWPGF